MTISLNSAFLQSTIDEKGKNVKNSPPLKGLRATADKNCRGVGYKPKQRSRMSVKSIRITAKEAVSDDQWLQRSRQLADALKQPMNGQLMDIEQRIRSFESRYEMTSQEMRGKFRSGDLKETMEICSWLMLLDIHDNASERTDR